ncbi:uncharacterized protein VP01_10g1 [Puccinia sorghi]|uniref:Uncharacterized protein n=1 Tax=Puccinia sorghi TaxID=27349 RepID=A0A0L6VT36_9BASI|nr:uncharacterized protein VP01_10g1 [Puccinia sorghi]
MRNNHCVDTCVALSLPTNITQIFMHADCTSNTEENNAGKLHCMHLPRRSQECTEFAHKLDLATIDYLPIPIGLPCNFYNLRCTHTENGKPPT